VVLPHCSDTETILAAYHRYGEDCLEHLRGMFAFALWDERTKSLFCARDRFGIKPFYYATVGNLFVFASEAKALLPFLPEIATDPAALAEYLTFQYTIGEATLFRGIKQLMPGHALAVENGRAGLALLDVRYEIDFEHNTRYFARRLEELLDDTVQAAPAQRRAGRRLRFGRRRFEPDRHSRQQDRPRHRRLFSRPLHRISRL
jgi:asparagine synthase (glutamine-hydrolysing)